MVVTSLRKIILRRQSVVFKNNKAPFQIVKLASAIDAICPWPSMNGKYAGINSNTQILQDSENNILKNIFGFHAGT